MNINWDNNDPEEDLVWKFWFAAQGWAVKHYGDLTDKLPELNFVDIQVIATDVLMGVGEKFDSVELRHPEARKNVFWHFVKRQIAWAFSNLLKAREGLHADESLLAVNSDGDEYESADVVRTQLRQNQSVSLLQTQLTDAFAAMHPAQQLALALRFFEGMTVEKVCGVLGMRPSSANRARRDAEIRILYAALMLTSNYRHATPEDPQPVFLSCLDAGEEWAQNTLGCTLDQYLSYVRACFALDPYYLVEIIEEANGTVKFVGSGRTARAMVRNGRALSDDQVRAIRDRLAAGVMQQTIADEFGTTKGSISLIKNRKTYDYVA